MPTTRLSRFHSSALLTAAFLITGCRGDVKDNSGIDPNSAIVQVVLNPPTNTITSDQFAVHQVFGITAGGDTTNLTVSWSADGGFVTSNGFFSALTTGVYKVVAMARDFPPISDTATITVIAPGVTLVDILIDPPSSILAPNEVRPFHATSLFNDSSEVSGAAVTWSATGGTIDAAGIYTAGANTGSFRVIATSQTDPIADTAIVTINAVAPVVQELVLSPDTISLRPGEGTTFRAFATYSDGTFAPALAVFSATGGSINQSGLYTASQVPGSYRVIALNQASGIADTAEVTVAGSSLVYLTISPASVALATGSTQAFSALGTFSDSTRLPISVTFSATGGTITPGGIYTAGSTTGPFRVVATDATGLFADTATVTLNAANATLTSIQVNPTTLSVLVGGTQQFNVVGFMSDGTQVAVPVAWSVSGGSITPTGFYTAPQTAGSYRVIAAAVSGGKADTTLVTVNPAVTLTKINVTPSNSSILTGGIQQFVATGQLSNGGATAVTVNWSATGGTISSTGQYTAGNTVGTFRVIAVQQGGTLADTSAVVIQVLPPPGSNACTFEPAGMTPVFNSPWDAVPPVAPANDAFGWNVRSLFERTNKLFIRQDAAAPKSPSNVIEGVFPQGSSGGSAPFRLTRNFNRNTAELYFCIFTMLDPQFTNNGNTGTKFGFILTPYAGGTSGLNHYFNLTTNLGINLQSAGAILNRNMRSSFSLVNHRGEWVKIEFYVKGNSVGNADGIARMWVNGVRVLDATDVQYFLPAQLPAFNGITWNPTYGGGSNPVPYDMSQFIDHWYLSIR
jgi:hypothetical protein